MCAQQSVCVISVQFVSIRMCDFSTVCVHVLDPATCCTFGERKKRKKKKEKKRRRKKVKTKIIAVAVMIFQEKQEVIFLCFECGHVF